MMEFGEFAELLKRSQAEIRPWLALDLLEIGTHQATVAAELIGHEIPQWPKLAESTIAEKERLGYVGQVSPTDPLLRTGANRDSIRVEVDPETLTEVTGSDRKEFKYMELGTTTVPARPSLAIAAAGSLEFAADVLHKTLVRALTGKKVEYENRDFSGMPKP